MRSLIALVPILLAGCAAGAQVPAAAPPPSEGSRPQADTVESGDVPAEPAAARAKTAAQYRAEAAAFIDRQVARAPIKGPAKNLIIFIGDGMGVGTITAGRIFEGEQQGRDGESLVAALDSLPYSALVKTYSTDFQVPDSAATATAIFTGTKSRSGTLGMAPSVTTGDCAASKGSPVETLFEQAEDAGRATGIISTARITHATPAATYAHSASRDWENDAVLPDEARAAGCIDIAAQLVNWNHGNGFELMMGGGRANFLRSDQADPEYPDKTGARTDGRNLAADWAAKTGGHYIWNGDQFAALPADGKPVLALFEPSHMQYDADRAEDPGKEPSIAAMTRAAIGRLSSDPDGFVLLVEGGRIDHAHHAGNAYRALDDFAAMDEAVRTALELTDPSDTMILVTADHSHVFTMAGYPPRGNPILGLVNADEDGAPATKDGKAYTTLGYANGPGAVPATGRPDPADVDTTAKDYLQQSLVPLGSETHSGEDVALKASGPEAYLVSGTIEQNAIYAIMAHALGLPLEK
ncbi:alkaline phosphatase [Novosphingopyxis sp.]|uniref:alkaline phosphatase n=1 Tax=Novosphingopyxis sp. TaxID=2709690 RepID=UPI003B5AACE3